MCALSRAGPWSESEHQSALGSKDPFKCCRFLTGGQGEREGSGHLVLIAKAKAANFEREQASQPANATGLFPRAKGGEGCKEVKTSIAFTLRIAPGATSNCWAEQCDPTDLVLECPSVQAVGEEGRRDAVAFEPGASRVHWAPSSSSRRSRGGPTPS